MMSAEAKNAAGGSCQRNQSLDNLKEIIQMLKTQTGVLPLPRLGVKQQSLVHSTRFLNSFPDRSKGYM